MTENERYCVRAGYWHNYTGIGRFEDENLTTNKVCNLINEQNETITKLEKENKKLKAINDQLEDRLEKSGIGIALKMGDFE